MKKKLIAVSGGFDPMHKGHVRMIREASKHGDVVVILNSDDWLERKKGYKFMNFEERSYIAGSIKGVILTSGVDDHDGTVCVTVHATGHPQVWLPCPPNSRLKRGLWCGPLCVRSLSDVMLVWARPDEHGFSASGEGAFRRSRT